MLIRWWLDISTRTEKSHDYETEESSKKPADQIVIDDSDEENLAQDQDYRNLFDNDEMDEDGEPDEVPTVTPNSEIVQNEESVYESPEVTFVQKEVDEEPITLDDSITPPDDEKLVFDEADLPDKASPRPSEFSQESVLKIESDAEEEPIQVHAATGDQTPPPNEEAESLETEAKTETESDGLSDDVNADEEVSDTESEVPSVQLTEENPPVEFRKGSASSVKIIRRDIVREMGDKVAEAVADEFKCVDSEKSDDEVIDEEPVIPETTYDGDREESENDEDSVKSNKVEVGSEREEVYGSPLRKDTSMDGERMTVSDSDGTVMDPFDRLKSSKTTNEIDSPIPNFFPKTTLKVIAEEHVSQPDLEEESKSVLPTPVEIEETKEISETIESKEVKTIESKEVEKQIEEKVEEEVVDEPITSNVDPSSVSSPIPTFGLKEPEMTKEDRAVVKKQLEEERDEIEKYLSSLPDMEGINHTHCVIDQQIISFFQERLCLTCSIGRLVNFFQSLHPQKVGNKLKILTYKRVRLRQVCSSES